MGISSSWIAIKGIDQAVLLDRLSVHDTGQVVAPWRSRLSFGRSNSDWLIVCSNDLDFASKNIAALSSGAQALGCWLEEHVMASGACAYSDEAHVWSIDYDCDPSKGLSTRGALPEVFESIHREVRAEQAAEEDADIVFDTPMRVVAALSDFRLDESDSESFTKLERSGASGGLPGFFAKWFGRKRV